MTVSGAQAVVQKIQQNTILKNTFQKYSQSNTVQKIQQNTILKNDALN